MNIGINEDVVPLLSETEGGRRKVRRRRHALTLLAICDLLFCWVPFFIEYRHDYSQATQDYTIPRSVMDVAILCSIRVVAVVFAVVRGTRKVPYIILHAVCLVCILLLGAKLIVFDYDDTAVSIIVTASSIFTMVEEILGVQVRSLLTTKALTPKRLSSKSMWTIGRAYFWPRGFTNKARVMATFVFLGASKGANILAPIFIGKAVEALTTGTTIPYAMIIMYCGLKLGSSWLKEAQSLIYLRVKQVAYVMVAEITFIHLHQLSLEWHLKKKMGNVIRSMDRGLSAADTVVNWLCLYLVPTIAECVVTFVIFWAHFKQRSLAAVVYLGFTSYCILTLEITEWRKKFREKTNKSDNDYHDKATDSLINYETVKYFTNEVYELKNYITSVELFQKYSVYTAASLSLLNGSQSGTVQMALVGGMLLAANAVLTADTPFTVGDFVAVQMYIAQIFTPLSFLGTVYSSIIRAIIDVQNLSELLAEEPDVQDIPAASPLRVPYDNTGISVEFRDVAFHYPAQPPSNGLRNITFDVPAGTTTAFVGKTGSGKTTLSRLLFRFYDRHSGTILINGQDITQVQQKSVRSIIGMVPQDTVLFNDTLLHNVKYGNLEASLADVEQAAHQAQVLDFIRTLPEGWDTKVGERGLKLSGGEKQRIAIARCLLKNPPVVWLDEATSALDTQTEKEVARALSNLSVNRTTIIIAHRLSTVRHADQIIVLRGGEIVERGTHDTLLEAGGEYHQMWMNQLEGDSPEPAGAYDD